MTSCSKVGGGLGWCDVSQSVVLAVIHYIAINVTETVSLFIGLDIHVNVYSTVNFYEITLVGASLVPNSIY